MVGNGETTSVWMYNWIKDPLPTAQKYKQEAVVELSLKVCDLMTEDQCGWDVQKVKGIVAEEDVP